MPNGPLERWDSQHAKWVPVQPSPSTPYRLAETPSASGDERSGKPRSSGRVVSGAAIGGIFPTKIFGKRMYASARSSRLASGFGMSNSSADSELTTSLAALRSRSRALVRDAAYAKRAKIVVVNNVVGAGIGMQAKVYNTRNQLNERVNDDIEQVWRRWSSADSCHTGGTLTFAALERAAMGQVFDAGEVIIRKHYTKFGKSAVPFTLELIEAERIADELSGIPRNVSVEPGNLLRMGVEVDPYFRPVAYWLHRRHQGEVFVGEQARDQLERVPADQIYHLKITDRWPQTRGEPWLHAVVRKLQDMDGYTEAEIVAARGAASYMGSIETPEGADGTLGEEQTDGSEQLELTPGIFEKLAPGEKMNWFAPNRPNSALPEFMRSMLREISAGVGVSYESISADFSQTNYSSSRLSLLETRDTWRVLQRWFIKSFREPLHAEWLQQAVLSGAIRTLPVTQYATDPQTFGESVMFKPRGWNFVDPQKEVEAYREAVRCGFTTVSQVLAQVGDGMDLEDLLDERRQELDDMAAVNLMFDTDPALAAPAPGATSDKPATPAESEPTESASAPVQPPADSAKAINDLIKGRELWGESRKTHSELATLSGAIESLEKKQSALKTAIADTVASAVADISQQSARTISGLRSEIAADVHIALEMPLARLARSEAETKQLSAAVSECLRLLRESAQTDTQRRSGALAATAAANGPAPQDNSHASPGTAASGVADAKSIKSREPKSASGTDG